MAENSRELALRRTSTLSKTNFLRHWASGGSASLRHSRSDSIPPGVFKEFFEASYGISNLRLEEFFLSNVRRLGGFLMHSVLRYCHD